MDFLRRHRLILLYVGISVLVFLTIIYFFWVRPNQQLNASKALLQPKEFIELKNSIRVGVAQAIGGAALLIGLFFTWRNLRLSQETAERNREIAQEGQITERFTKAVEQLGNKESMATRLGGIYALERIAKDSERDHWPIMEILTAYVRETAPLKGIEEPVPQTIEEAARTLSLPLNDVQAIIRILSRRMRSYEKDPDQRLYLFRVDLRRYSLINAHLENAYLGQSHLELSSLKNAHLERAILYKAHLEYTILAGTHLEETNLKESFLQGARIIDTHFEGAIFDGAHLEGVDLSFAIGLTQAQIDSARTDEKTLLPKGLHLPKLLDRKAE